MWTHIVSLLQNVVVWNGDIIVNVSGGSVDWIGLSETRRETLACNLKYSS